ncbi:hydrogenase 3 membrane subunit [Eggerthellaceae bacterium zg-1084]|uniref:Hydrogenase 3 membrane subunit n=1 Tax=Berryella wangjianweii TaxID=2734634 RepID=A0A6M8J7K8_9ACTN|nr:NADH-quinone oxidoreductase subunit H [Berryella wangjianweii]NPD30778.1 hydrogenase 3 membrane subunit [Berryella wangjianweii]NPD32003.1 hydrogenase 3 membrane subunit [Eggerthellaceae bacterium zg-997]QKF07409.1 hydrogenase 3 membrane subunit [Berryella wangjianweii]
MAEIIIGILQALLLLLLAPLFSGVSRFLRAKIHTRKGPPILQDYYDIVKLLRRQDLHTADASFVSRLMPPLFLAVMFLLACGIPMITRFSPVPALGDIIAIIYLLAIPRFFFALAGVDRSNAYGGLGGIRELLIGVLVEPSMMLALFVVAIATGTTNVGGMGEVIGSMATNSPVAVLVAGIAFAAACYIELGKLPYDAAEAEQEIQEGPLQEYSGPSLAMIKVAMSMKQVIVISWFVAIFLPFGSATDMSFLGLLTGEAAYVLKVGVIALLCTFIENSVSRVRWKYVGRQTWLVVGISLVAFVFCALGM